MHMHKCVTASNVHGELHVQVPAVHDKFIAVSQLTAGEEVVLQAAPPRPTFNQIENIKLYFTLYFNINIKRHSYFV